MYRTDRLPTEV